jgi:hypothetical protein
MHVLLHDIKQRDAKMAGSIVHPPQNFDHRQDAPRIGDDRHVEIDSKPHFFDESGAPQPVQAEQPHRKRQVTKFVGVEPVWAAGEPAEQKVTQAEQEPNSRAYMYATSAIYCLSLFAVGSGFGARGPALTSLARQVGMLEDGDQCAGLDGGGANGTSACSTACAESDINEMAWAQACFNIGFIVCSFAAGFIMEAAGRRWHWVLSLSGAVAALAMVLQTVVTSPGGLYATFGLLGLVCAFPATATQAGPLWVWTGLGHIVALYCRSSTLCHIH